MGDLICRLLQLASCALRWSLKGVSEMYSLKAALIREVPLMLKLIFLLLFLLVLKPHATPTPPGVEDILIVVTPLGVEDHLAGVEDPRAAPNHAGVEDTFYTVTLHGCENPHVDVLEMYSLIATRRGHVDVEAPVLVVVPPGVEDPRTAPTLASIKDPHATVTLLGIEDHPASIEEPRASLTHAGVEDPHSTVTLPDVEDRPAVLLVELLFDPTILPPSNVEDPRAASTFAGVEDSPAVIFTGVEDPRAIPTHATIEDHLVGVTSPNIT
ncbi:hypothetical protein A4A49_14260 [Nicotiana attenuata]|uniref:Uncharacterized protein n=1 Tax=Nicotiana attenuata TaxID=49451 RepID=A0A314L3D5_NICAT|nr:hypothetical protein A4A49_14260 [Nicotiana attenuata]